MSANPSSYVKVQVKIHDSVREDYRTMSHTSDLPMAILMRHAITSFLDNASDSKGIVSIKACAPL